MSTEELSRTGTAGRGRPARRSYWPARLRVLRALAKLALAGLFLAVFTVGACRVTRMIGLPDVGDPFGPPAPVKPSGAGADPMALYVQALGQVAWPEGVRTIPRSDPRMTWENATPAVRQWVKQNRGPLDLFRLASQLPGNPGSWDATSRSAIPLSDANLGELVWLTLLEGDRLADAGDAEAAWEWYLAALRSTYHRAQLRDQHGRMVAQWLRAPVAVRIDAWAEDSRVGPAKLRRALEGVLACRGMTPSDMETLEDGYRQVMMEIDGGQWSQPMDRGDIRFGREGWLEPLSFSWWQAGRFLDNEPERSRRVVRLAFANWQAWLARPDGERPRPAVKAIAQFDRRTERVDLFEPGPEASAAARRMSPRRLAGWYESCRDARYPLSSFWSTFRAARAGERTIYRGLVVHLAEQLCLRERGKLPPNPEALVGPYLKSLPDDGSSELDDGTTPGTSPE